MALRSIKTFFGRYMALLSIILISVAFFAGLKVTTDAMVNAGALYYDGQNFYDFRLISTIGFSDDEVEYFSDREEVSYAEGATALEADAAFEGEENTYQFLLIPEKVNLPVLLAGRMPETKEECLADASVFSENDIGKSITLADSNSSEVLELFETDEYTIVGLARSPLYLSSDLSSGSSGGGSLKGFFYLGREGFAGETYTEIHLTFKEREALYSGEYNDRIDKVKPVIEDALDEAAKERYQDILEEAGLTPELAEQFGMEEPENYVLTRKENAGYVSFENDTSIISGIANVFPVFFILVAMLVCMTTMTRMIEEERTQIGVLKALGFSGTAITMKYMLYAVSATVIGWGAGFFLGTWGIPQIFWIAYQTVYDFSSLPYLFSPSLAVGTIAAALAGTMGSTWFSCYKELYDVPAALLRPRAPKAGKRVLLERITGLWRRLPFLQKVSLRNMFLYKKRFIMMLVGISGCTALLVTGFGVKDSIISVGYEQYVTTQKYDLEASFPADQAEEAAKELDKSGYVEDYLFFSSESADLLAHGAVQAVQFFAFQDDRLAEFWNLESMENAGDYREKGKALISSQAAKRLGISEGSTVEVRLSDMQTAQVEITGIFENYINNYLFVSDQTYAEAFGEWEADSACIYAAGEEKTAAEELRKLDAIGRVGVLSDSLKVIEDSLACLNYVVALLIVFAGVLAFIVIYNLTNINLSERVREIATVKVLGFYPKETDSYILRENLIMSAIGGLIGLPLGIALHQFVMYMIAVDGMQFQIRIEKINFVIAFVMTIVFAVLINLYMHRQIEKIPMAESLKTVE